MRPFRVFARSVFVKVTKANSSIFCMRRAPRIFNTLQPSSKLWVPRGKGRTGLPGRTCVAIEQLREIESCHFSDMGHMPRIPGSGVVDLTTGGSQIRMDNANPGLNNPFTSRCDPCMRLPVRGLAWMGLGPPRIGLGEPRSLCGSWMRGIGLSPFPHARRHNCRPVDDHLSPTRWLSRPRVPLSPCLPCPSGPGSSPPPPPPSYRNRRTRQKSKQTISEWAAAFGVRTASTRRKAGSGRGRSEDSGHKIVLRPGSPKVDKPIDVLGSWLSWTSLSP